MKRQIFFFALWFPAFLAAGQGTFIYDQQSANESTFFGVDFWHIELEQPMGQSFTPTSSSVGFISLVLEDPVSNGVGATVYLNLWAGSIGGTFLGSTAPVFIPDNFGTLPQYPGFTNFFFPTPVAVAPGTTYYFQPQLGSGSDNANVNYSTYSYSGGTMIRNGAPVPGWNLWFREGIYVVPEPAPSWLVLVSGVVLLYARHKHPKPLSS
ncbi:MAG: hypothetical protein KGJ60_04235 [Verrucomicrobiota bacterium]|nr:hypothetical protein [Verrucomicrobiota bacterium]